MTLIVVSGHTNMKHPWDINKHKKFERTTYLLTSKNNLMCKSSLKFALINDARLVNSLEVLFGYKWCKSKLQFK